MGDFYGLRHALQTDINRLWSLRDENKALLCVKHNHIPDSEAKF